MISNALSVYKYNALYIFTLQEDRVFSFQLYQFLFIQSRRTAAAAAAAAEAAGWRAADDGWEAPNWWGYVQRQLQWTGAWTKPVGFSSLINLASHSTRYLASTDNSAASSGTLLALPCTCLASCRCGRAVKGPTTRHLLGPLVGRLSDGWLT